MTKKIEQIREEYKTVFPSVLDIGCNYERL